jgi:kinesin family member 5
MFGTDESQYGKAEVRGIIPRACEEILQAVKQRAVMNQIDTVIKVSYVEIYGDQVSDLLRNGARCGQSKVASQRFVLSGAAETEVQCIEDFYELLHKGDLQKRRAATAMNDRSTRAHSLFIVTLHQSKLGSDVTLRSRLFLADLGGSEQVKKSQVEAGKLREGFDNAFSVGFEKAQHMREAVYINLGLLALKKCVEALNNGSPYVPYQDSKLTMLLSEGLGGNSKTSIIVCANLNPVHSHETLATLRFGENCAKIELEARNNASMMAGLIAQLDNQIKTLEAEILRKERWVVEERRREDVLAEEGTFEKASGATEVMKVSVVTGAEAERIQLEKLLRQRVALLGSSAVLPGEEEQEENVTKSKKKVLGFGKQYAEIYGLGSKFDEAEEEKEENSRFNRAIREEELPTALLRAKKGTKSWALGEGVPASEEQVRKVAAKANRSKLAYSGVAF